MKLISVDRLSNRLLSVIQMKDLTTVSFSLEEKPKKISFLDNKVQDVLKIMLKMNDPSSIGISMRTNFLYKLAADPSGLQLLPSTRKQLRLLVT